MAAPSTAKRPGTVPDLEQRPAGDVAFNTVSKAATDGLLVAFVDASPDDERDGEVDLSVSAGATRHSIVPRAGSHAQFVERWGVWVRYGAVTVPIRKGEHYRAAAPAANATGSLLRLGDRPDSLGPPVVDAPATASATEDGLLLVNLTTDTDGARGSAYGTVNGQRVAGCSVHAFAGHQRRSTHAGFCMPVRRGQAYRVEVVETSATLTMTATWYPLAGLTFPAKATRIEPSAIYAPDGAGLVFGYLHTDNGPRGVVRLWAGRDARSMTVRQAAAAHQCYGVDPYLPDAGLAVPISHGECYCLEQVWSAPTPDARFFWLSVESGGV
jgi:hypothetical protein